MFIGRTRTNAGFPLIDDLTIAFRSRWGERFIFLEKRSQIQFLALSCMLAVWMCIASAMTMGGLLINGKSGSDNLVADESELHALIEERNILRHENENLEAQLKEALELILGKEHEINRFQKTLTESQALSLGNQVVMSPHRRDMISGMRPTGHGDATLATLLRTLRRSNDKVRDVRHKVSELEAQMAQSRFQDSFENAQINTVLSRVHQSVDIASEGLEGILRSLNINPSNLKNEVRSIYRGTGATTQITLNLVPELKDIPVFDTASDLEQSLDKLNSLRLVYMALPFADPLKGSFTVSSGYGMRRHPVYRDRRMHNGVDYTAPKGTRVHATGYGKVEFAGTKSGYGKIVVIRHISGVRSAYAHLSRIHVKKGEKIEINDVIGEVGSTGVSTGNHLHYEIRYNRKAINPMKFLKV